MNKYIKCFSKNKSKELIDLGYEFMYEQNGTYFFKNDEKLNRFVKFSESDCLDDTVIKTKFVEF